MDLTCAQTNGSLSVEIFEQFYSLIYGIPTTILYGVIVFSIRTQTHLYSSVYADLITISSACNVLCWWLQFLFGQFVGFSPWCQFWVDLSGEYQLTLPYFFFSCSPIANFAACCAICIYQMFAIIFPTTNEQRFRSKMWLVYVAIMAIPSLCCIHVLFSNTQIIPLSNTRSYVKVTHFYDWMSVLKTSTITVIAGAVSCLIIFPCSIICATCFYNLRKKNHGTAKLRSFFVNLYICLSTVIFIVFQILIMYSRLISPSPNFLAALYGIRALIADVCYLPIPWVILLVNPRMRSAIITVFRKKTRTMVSPKITSSH